MQESLKQKPKLLKHSENQELIFCLAAKSAVDKSYNQVAKAIYQLAILIRRENSDLSMVFLLLLCNEEGQFDQGDLGA